MKELVNRLIEENRALTKNGNVANYIPILGNADPKDLGISIIDNNGNIYSCGNYDKIFTIQSISKVIALMLAIIDNGEEEVFKRVGMEATDEPFNSLYKLDFPHIDKPANPMINAGAIVTTSLIKGDGKKS